MGIRITPRHDIPTACHERFAPLEHPAYGAWQDLGVVRCGLSRLAPGYHIANPDPQRLMVVANVDGLGYAQSEHGDWRCEPDSCLLGLPGEAIAFGCAGEYWTIAWWYCLPDPRWPLPPHSCIAPWARTRLLWELLEALFAETGQLHMKPEQPSPPRRRGRQPVDRASALADLIASYLQERLFAGHTVPASQGEEQRLDALLQRIDRRLDRDWPVAEAARAMGCSPATLQRLARRLHGRSWHQLLIARRMQHACQLLKHTDYPIAVIAEQLGYCDAFTFSGAFKRQHRLAPAHWRAAAQAGDG